MNVLTMPLQPYAFSPATITVAPGTTVVWTNGTNAPHTVTADDGSWGSDVLNQGDTYSYTFQTPGVYAYQCAIHSFMHGTVIVGTPPPTATSSATATPTTTPVGNSHRDQHSRVASLGDEHGDADDYRVANHHADRHTHSPGDSYRDRSANQHWDGQSLAYTHYDSAGNCDVNCHKHGDTVLDL